MNEDPKMEEFKNLIAEFGESQRRIARNSVKIFIRKLQIDYGYVRGNSPYEDGFLEALAQIDAELDNPTAKAEGANEITG